MRKIQGIQKKAKVKVARTKEKGIETKGLCLFLFGLSLLLHCVHNNSWCMLSIGKMSLAEGA